MEDDLYSLIDKGEKALARGETLVALMLFEAAIELRPLAAAQSALAYCLARERRQFARAFALCREALGADHPATCSTLKRAGPPAMRGHHAPDRASYGHRFSRYSEGA